MNNKLAIAILFSLTLFTILSSSASAEQVCYTSVTQIPSTCTGGTITQDTVSGTCRTLVCASGGNSIQVLACDKPDIGTKTYFEMYKQTSSGVTPKLCIDGSCMQNDGYARSQDFPICIQQSTPDAVLIVTDLGDHNYNLFCEATASPPPSTHITVNVYGVNGTQFSYTFDGPGPKTGEIVQIPAGQYEILCNAEHWEYDSCGSAGCPWGDDKVALTVVEGTQNICYANVNDLPVTCSSWGTITSDTFDGCRYVTCSDATGNYPGEYYTAKACDKPGSNNPTTLELYSAGRRGFAGTEICFGSACISSGIPYKLYSYPLCSGNITPPICTPSVEVCDQKDNDCDGQVDEGNVCTPPGDTCYASLNDLPANCTGTITSDVKAGGRTITCSAPNGNIQVQAWEKADSTGKYFTIYRQSSSGTVPQVCIGNTCLQSGWGYQKGTYFPVCMSTTQPPNATDPGASSTLSIASGTINGQSVSTGSQVTVSPGQQITGTLNLAYNDAWPQNINIPLIATSSWGDHSTSFTSLGNAYGTGKTVNIAYTAPTTPGTYYLIFAYRAEVTYAQVASATNWNYGSNVWNDANDIASFTSAQISAANTNGRTIGSVLTTSGYHPYWVPATAITVIVQGTPTPANDPGATSSITIQGGSLNGQSLSNANKRITVNPGQAISGNVQFGYTSTFGSNAIMQFASTSTWGDHATSCTNQGSLTTPATGSLSANINTIAPTTPGTYYFVFAYSGEFNKDQVCSMTNWGRSGGIVYNDGNDLADWNLSQVQQSQANGRATSYRMYDDGYHYVYTPSDVVTVVVAAPSTPPACYQSVMQQAPACLNSQLVSDQPVDGCRQFVCTSNTGSITVKACDKPSTSFHPYYFEMYKTVNTGYGPDFCLGSTCFVNSGFAQSQNAPACLLTPDARGWMAYLPGWSYSNGIYYATNTHADVPVESYYPEGFGWADYNVSVSMNTQSGYAPADSQLILRYQSSLNYVACRIMQYYNGTTLEIVDPQHNVLNSIQYPFNVGQWYTLQAGIHGSTATCQVAGHPETMLTATYTLTSTGTVGLRATHIPVQYKDMTVAFG